MTPAGAASRATRVAHARPPKHVFAQLLSAQALTRHAHGYEEQIGNGMLKPDGRKSADRKPGPHKLARQGRRRRRLPDGLAVRREFVGDAGMVGWAVRTVRVPQPSGAGDGRSRWRGAATVPARVHAEWQPDGVRRWRIDSPPGPCSDGLACWFWFKRAARLTRHTKMLQRMPRMKAVPNVRDVLATATAWGASRAARREANTLSPRTALSKAPYAANRAAARGPRTPALPMQTR